MKNICSATGLSRGGLYRNYDSTRQIFSEIVDRLISAQDNELLEKINAGYVEYVFILWNRTRGI